MKLYFKWLALALAFVWLPTVALAASPWTEKSKPVECMAAKFVFGVKNLLFGWTELFTEPMEYHKDGKNCLEGLGKGFVNAVGQTVGGAVHAVTFLIPIDVPLPENGTQFLK